MTEGKKIQQKEYNTNSEYSKFVIKYNNHLYLTGKEKIVYQLRKGICITIVFLLGSIATININLFNILIAIGILFNFSFVRKTFSNNLKKGNIFLKIPLLFCLYMSLHTLVLKYFGQETVAYRYSIFESLFFYFIAIPLYLFSNRDLLENSKFLKALLSIFMIAVTIFNTTIFFQLAGYDFFQDPLMVINQIAANRFGGNKEVFGGFLFLEPQTLYINLAAIIAYYYAILSRKLYHQIGYIFIFLLLIFFLILTETKSAYIVFIIGFLAITFFLLKNKTPKFRWKYSVIFISCFTLLLLSTPESFRNRLKEAQNELNNTWKGNLSGGSTIMPRVALYKVNFTHLNEYGLWGLGVAYSNTIKKWYNEANYGIEKLTDPHNSFMFFWLTGGVIGLLFALSLFFLPLWEMLRKRKFSFLAIALWLMMFIANNTTVLLDLNDSKSLIIFFLTLLYLKSSEFKISETEYLQLKK